MYLGILDTSIIYPRSNDFPGSYITILVYIIFSNTLNPVGS